MSSSTKKYDVFFVHENAQNGEWLFRQLETLGCRVTSFAHAGECLDNLSNENCDLIITEMALPDMDGLTLLKQVKTLAPWVSVIIITDDGDIPLAVRSIQQGAADFLEKPLEKKTFARKVREILQNDNFDFIPTPNRLTKAEKRVLKLILQGKSNKEIAYALGRTQRTIEQHRSKVMHKFGAENIVDLVQKASGLDTEKLP